MEISKMLTISTAHIRPDSTRFLDDEYTFGDAGLVLYGKDEYGWFIYISDIETYKRVPQDIVDCMKFARSHDCHWLCLDCDAEVINELPTYHW